MMWDNMHEETEDRLVQLGVDTDGLNELIEAEDLRAFNYVLGICNLDIMPEVLKPVCVDIACAAVITAAGEGGRLKLAENTSLSSIKEGDVTLTFDNTCGNGLVKALTDRLSFNDKSLLISYRRLKW